MNAQREDTNRNLGRAAAKLGVEDKLLSDGVLSQKPLAERAAVVEGVVDGIVEKGNWRSVVNLVFGNGTVKALYDGDRNALVDKVMGIIKPEDFHPEDDRFFASIELLADAGYSERVYNLALREDMPADVSRVLLWKIKDQLGETRHTEGLQQLGVRLIGNNPLEAYKIFSETRDFGNLRQLYEQLMTDFKLEHVETLMDIATDYNVFETRDNVVENVTEITRRVLRTRGKEKHDQSYGGRHGSGFKLGAFLYLKTRNHPAELTRKERRALERLAARHVDYKHLLPRNQFLQSDFTPDQRFAPLAIKWAQLHWREEPVKAYGIFSRGKYEGKEIIPCAKAAYVATWKVMQKPESERFGDTVAVSKDHVTQFYDELMETEKLELRLDLAKHLEDHKAVRRIADEYANDTSNEWNLTHAYGLRFRSGVKPSDTKLAKWRERLIAREVANFEENGYGLHHNWLPKGDRVGYEAAFAETLSLSPEKAYELAKGFDSNDEKALTTASAGIIATLQPEKALSFFREAKDTVGYELSLRKLAQKYGVSKADLARIVPQIQDKP